MELGAKVYLLMKNKERNKGKSNEKLSKDEIKYKIKVELAHQRNEGGGG
jgi:hypothetical protein